MKKLSMIVAGVAFAASACTAPTMVVPADVAGMDADVINATERKNASGAFVNESFKLGPYSVADVDRDWDSTKTRGAGPVSSEKTTSGYAYVLKTEGGELPGACGIEGATKGVSFGGGMSMSKSVSKMTCACEVAGAEAKAVLDAGNDGKYAGTINVGEGEWTITAINEANGSLPSGNPSGYRVDGDGVVAAVDVMHPGRLWLGKALSQETKDRLACVFTGLMLYKGEDPKF